MTIEFKETLRKHNLSVLKDDIHVNALVKNPDDINGTWKLGWKDRISELTESDREVISKKIKELNQNDGPRLWGKP